jgi:hypothetical protein
VDVIVGEAVEYGSPCPLWNCHTCCGHRSHATSCIHGDREAIYHAVMLDPLTGAVCTLDEIRRITDDLFAAKEA